MSLHRDVRSEDLEVAQLVRVFDELRADLVRETYAHGPESWAEDAIHDAWVIVQGGKFTPRRTVRTDEEALAWVRRVVRNRARNRRRTENLRCHRPLDAIEHIAEEHQDEPDCLRDERIVDAIRELPRAQRLVTELWCDGWTLSEIATANDWSLGAVKQHWHRAKKKLRMSLGDQLKPGA